MAQDADRDALMTRMWYGSVTVHMLLLISPSNSTVIF